MMLFVVLSCLLGVVAPCQTHNVGYNVTLDDFAMFPFVFYFNFDTASHILAGRMENDCRDINITTNSGLKYTHWRVPGTCYTKETGFFVEIPHIMFGRSSELGFNFIMNFRFGCPSAFDSSLDWGGNFIYPSKEVCDSVGLTSVSDMEGKFLYAGSSFTPITNSLYHNHTTTTECSGRVDYGIATAFNGIAGGAFSYNLDSDPHDISPVKVNDVALPHPVHRTAYMCSGNAVVPSDGPMVGFLTPGDASAAGYTHDTTYDGKYLYGGVDAPEDVSGGGTHYHETLTGQTLGVHDFGMRTEYPFDIEYDNGMDRNHNHILPATMTSAASTTPNYIELVLAYHTPSGNVETVINEQMIVFADSLPPLGVFQVAEGSNNFIKGGVTKSTGGDLSHSHTYTIISGTTLPDDVMLQNTGDMESPQILGTVSHYHNLTGTTDAMNFTSLLDHHTVYTLQLALNFSSFTVLRAFCDPGHLGESCEIWTCNGKFSNDAADDGCGSHGICVGMDDCLCMEGWSQEVDGMGACDVSDVFDVSLGVWAHELQVVLFVFIFFSCWY